MRGTKCDHRFRGCAKLPEHPSYRPEAVTSAGTPDGPEQQVDEFRVARITKFISKFVSDELDGRLDDPYQDFALVDMGTEAEWSEIFALGLGSYLAELIAQTCVSGLDEKHPETSAVRAQMSSVGDLPREVLGFDFDPEPEYLALAAEMFDAALRGTDTELVKEKIDRLDGDGQANVILNAVGFFTVLVKFFHQLAMGSPN